MLVETSINYKSALESTPIIIWITDEKGRCIFINKKWVDVTGKTADAALGNKWFELIHPEDRQAAYSEFIGCMHLEMGYRRTFRYLNADGRYKLYDVDASPRFNDSGEMIGYIGVMAQRNLLNAAFNLLETVPTIVNQKISSFISLAAHDLREPARKISAFSSLIAKVEISTLTEKSKDYLSRMQSASQRLTSMIEALTEYSRLDALEEEYTDVDLNQLVSQINQKVSKSTGQTSVEFITEDLSVIYTLPDHLEKLLKVILHNAVKFAREGAGTEIKIALKNVQSSPVPVISHQPEVPFYCISISDNGIGFDPKYNSKIFELFGRLNGRTKYDGSGIGLSLAKKIVEKMEGFITVESEESKGSTFRVYLPINSKYVPPIS